MEKSLNKILTGYKKFREKYLAKESIEFANWEKVKKEQKPEVMVISCSDSRADPAIIFQCDPGDLLIVRNVANLIPPYEKDEKHHGTSAAIEFGVKFLKVKHLIILGHSNCQGIKTALNNNFEENDFLSNWLKITNFEKKHENCSLEDNIKSALENSYQNCLTFPFIKEKIKSNELKIHKWLFDIESATIKIQSKDSYKDLDINSNFSISQEI